MDGPSLDSKPWYRSKAVWAGIITAVLGIIQPVSSAIGHPVQVPLWMIEFLTGIGLYAIRTGNQPIGK